MFAYHLPEGLPAGSRTVWSQLPLQPLAAQPLTPFSYSILDEVAKSAWYHYFDELGFEPMPRARVLRQIQGRAYLNLTLSAQRDAEMAAVEPLTLQINGHPFPLAKWEKPGLLAGLKTNRNRKKIEQRLESYGQQMPAITQKAESWYQKTQELRWTQADILQIMEEVERVSIESFKVFLAARYNLELIYHALLWATHGRQPFPQNMGVLAQAVGDCTELVEYQIAEQVRTLGITATADRTAVEWLAAGRYTNWESTLPNPTLHAAVTSFLQRYGHRSSPEGEISHARWQQDPSLLFAAVTACVQQTPPLPVQRAPDPQRLLEAVAPDQRKTVQQQLAQIHPLLRLQSEALHAFAYILAGTRRWALAAATEALADQRLQQVEDIFFFQVEEVKQMMTGEWNISARADIQATCRQRRAEVAHWQQEEAAKLWIGDTAATPAQPGLPGAGGTVTGVYQQVHVPAPCQGHKIIVGVPHLDSGWALLLPVTPALVTAHGSPLDPVAAAAHAWHIPTVLGVGKAYQTFVEGAPATLSPVRGVLEQ